MAEEIQVRFRIREGEHGEVARFEFPEPRHIFEILENTSPEEQKKYISHTFDNILVSREYSQELLKFLLAGAKKAGFEIKFIKRKIQEEKQPLE